MPSQYLKEDTGHDCRSTQVNQTLDPELKAYVEERVAPYKKIRIIEFTDEIPKSASGKILRRVLVDQERAKQGGGA